MIKKIIPISLLSLIYVIDLHAQTEMADGMRSNGKIYVVVVVLATIFAGIFAYLWKLDRKISRLENEKKKNNF
jgi:CcmD family protein